MASKEYWEAFDREVADAAKQRDDDAISNFNPLRYAKRLAWQERMHGLVQKCLKYRRASEKVR